MSWKALKSWWSRLFTPKIWAVKDEFTGTWHKAVCYRRPVAYPLSLQNLRGPFRSDVDCEEYCDRLNSTGPYRHLRYLHDDAEPHRPFYPPGD